jgi:hypothetical protein
MFIRNPYFTEYMSTPLYNFPTVGRCNICGYTTSFGICLNASNHFRSDVNDSIKRPPTQPPQPPVPKDDYEVPDTKYIAGPDFQEITVPMLISDVSEINMRYEERCLRVWTTGSRRYRFVIVVSNENGNPTVQNITYLNGIVKIRLSK